MPVRGPHGPGTHGLGPGGLGPHGLAPTVWHPRSGPPWSWPPGSGRPRCPWSGRPRSRSPGSRAQRCGKHRPGLLSRFSQSITSCSCLGSSCVRVARLCPRGKPVSAGEGLWGPREAARSQASPFPGAEAGVSPPGLQGVRGRRGSHCRGKPVGTDAWLPGHAWLCRPQPGPRELPSLCKVSVTRKRDFLTAQL